MILQLLPILMMLSVLLIGTGLLIITISCIFNRMEDDTMTTSRRSFLHCPDSELESPATVHKSKEIHVVSMDREVLNQMLLTIGSKEAEHGGALGMDNETACLTRFFYDENGSRSSVAYSPDAEAMTEAANHWANEGVTFCGIVHSHPGYISSPSEGDRQYAETILKAMPETLGGSFFMPIVTVNLRKHTASIFPFMALYDSDKQTTEIIKVALMVDGELIEDELPIPAEPTVIDDAVTGKDTSFTEEVLFQRNASILPLNETANRTVVIVGCGGARGFCESLARSSVHRFILIDGDTVSETNMATQGTYIDEIGMYKTEVIANTLRRINPNVQVTEIRRFLDNGFTDEEFAAYIGADLLKEHPEHVLLCGCTDNFPAQDRTVKLALKLGVPYLASQTYAEGRGGEVIFSYPGVTTACPHCMLASRYSAYEQGAQDTVTSEGAPIYATERLNALKSHVAMMLLLYGTSSRLGKELEHIRDRNLILVSFTADCEEKLGITAFSRTLAPLDASAKATLPMEETVWLQQKPDRPENGFDYCPYCGGVGDSRILRGMIADTRDTLDLRRFIAAVQPTTITEGGDH